MNNYHKILLSFVLFMGIQSISSAQQTEDVDQLKINQIQIVGTHNSYARPVDPQIMNYVEPKAEFLFTKFFESMSDSQKAKYMEYHPNQVSFEEGLRYNHPPLHEQLDSGIRNIELDVYYDPQGGKFIEPASYVHLKKQGATGLAYMDKKDLDKPGFKVLHMADLDFRTYHTTFRSALQELRSWSDQNPDHFPIFIMVEAKEDNIPLFPKPTMPLKFDEQAFQELDKEAIAILGREKIITPDDIRGNYATLREAVLSKNWPEVKASRGKFIFLLLPNTAGLGEFGGVYAQSTPNLEGRAMFVNSSGKESFSAFLLMDNAILRQKEIQQFVKDGFMVRTRSDIETYEAKMNDFSRAEAAFESGAQIISTDFIKLPNTYGTEYKVTLPGNGEARVNPVNGKLK